MSKIQFNLLPDVKLEYNRTQRIKRLAYGISTLAVVVSVGLFILMIFTVDIVQKKQMSDAGKKVDEVSKQLKDIPQIDQIVTIQNQLKTLTSLHENRHNVSRIFTYLPKITPANVSINKLEMDTVKSTMTISGTASSQKDVNTFVDTLKQTTFKIDSTDQPSPAFSSVIESAFNINPTNVGYTISMQFDSKLFANNLTNSQGKKVTPQITVNKVGNASNLKDPASTLFNSTQTSTEGR
jgi:Tfp pilus assembly protein PilN